MQLYALRTLLSTLLFALYLHMHFAVQFTDFNPGLVCHSPPIICASTGKERDYILAANNGAS